MANREDFKIEKRKENNNNTHTHMDPVSEFINIPTKNQNFKLDYF